MLGSSKPAASLSSGLLARKGHARPAMRPQGYVSISPAPAHDDLGWNDMGEDVEPAPVPVPVLQREQLSEAFAPPPAVPEPRDEPGSAPVSVATAARIAREVTAHKTKAAFTLRLDTDRHLRLRLASAVSHRSAQQLVSEALDKFLESLPEVEELASRLPARKSR